MKYYVYCRYEYYGKNGITFTDWFIHGADFNTEKMAKEYLQHVIDDTKYVDSKTKRKHEFEIRYLDETLLPQIKLRRPRGRAKKISEEILNDICKKLFRSKNGKTEIDAAITPFIFNSEEYMNYINDKVNKKYNGEKWPRFWYDENKVGYVILKDKTNKLIC